MKIVQITAGAGGRICGSCLHDNALVRALPLEQAGRVSGITPADLALVLIHLEAGWRAPS